MNENTNTLECFPTCELVEELKRREGVKTEVYGAYEEYQIEGNGPAIILTVID